MNHKMNVYLFCSLMFISFMKSSHTASLYPLSVQKSAKESYNLHFDESQLVLNNVEQSEMNMQDDLKHLNIESLMGKNITYQVIIIAKNSAELLCQGALIDPFWIVTSAACLKKYTLSFSSILVVTGFHLSSALISEIKEVYINPEFEMLTNLNDVALVKLVSPISDEVIPVSLTSSKVPKTNRCDFSAIHNNTMVAFRVDLVSPQDCIRPGMPQQKLYYYCAGASDKQITLTEDDVLGVPLVCDDYLYGIKSLSTIFTSIPDVYDWIVTKMGHEPYHKIDNYWSNHFSPEKNRNQELKPNSELKYPESEENNKYKSQGFISGSEDTNFTTPEGYEENTTPLIITIPKESQEVETTTHFLFFW